MTRCPNCGYSDRGEIRFVFPEAESEMIYDLWDRRERFWAEIRQVGKDPIEGWFFISTIDAIGLTGGKDLTVGVLRTVPPPDLETAPNVL